MHSTVLESRRDVWVQDLLVTDPHDSVRNNRSPPIMRSIPASLDHYCMRSCPWVSNGTSSAPICHLTPMSSTTIYRSVRQGHALLHVCTAEWHSPIVLPRCAAQNGAALWCTFVGCRVTLSFPLCAPLSDRRRRRARRATSLSATTRGG